jgi:hypothetical protein
VSRIGQTIIGVGPNYLKPSPGLASLTQLQRFRGFIPRGTTENQFRSYAQNMLLLGRERDADKLEVI